MRIIVAIWGGLLIMSAAQAALYEPMAKPFVTIAAGGQPQAQIVIPAEPEGLEQFAATELQRYLKQMSGAELPIVADGQDLAHPFSFYIGETEKNLSRAIDISEETMGRDGFALHSVPDGICIFGPDKLSPVFGVYEILERWFDVRWFMPISDDVPADLAEHVPTRDTLQMGQVDLVVKPDFRVRWVGNGAWPLAHRMNAFVKADGEDVGINWKWHFHTFRTLIPPDKYYEDHPEWFALVDGERKITDSKSHGNQLCTSTPELVAEVAKNMIAVLDADPSIEIIALSPNDGGGFCECESCTALDEPERDWFAKYSRRLAIFNNQVAKIVGEKHPDTLIKVGAYAMYARPPLDEDFRPEPNLLYQLCHIYFCHNHPLGSEACVAGETYDPSHNFQPNQEYAKILEQWRELSPHLFMYEYYTLGGIAKGNLPWPLVHTMRTDIPYYRDHGIEGFYTQLSGNLYHRYGLNYYIAAKLCWDPDLDPDALLEDYFSKFYGIASRPMRRYFDTLEQAMIDWNGCSSYGLKGTAHVEMALKVYTPEVMARLQAALAEAEGTSNTDRIAGQRVMLARRMYQELEASLAEMGR